MASSPFARARQFLDYDPIAKWSALVASVGTGLLFLCFLVLLQLFADQLVNRGAILSLDHLPKNHREYFKQTRRERLDPVPAQQWFERIQTMGLLPESEKNAAATPPLARYAAEEEPEKNLSRREQQLHWEIRWRWFVHSYIRQNVGSAATEHVAAQTRQSAESIGPELTLDRDLPNCGVLSLIVRVHDRPHAGPLCWLAWLNPWMWDYGFTTYLLVLFVVAVIAALARAGLMFANKYMAAVAVTEAVTRLRRAIYHHTYRLGTLAFRALGPTEAVSVSTRHLESVHDGLYAWLTAYFREPIKFFLLLLFALLVNVWLAVAFVMFALLVWMIGGQIAAFYRRQGRLAGERAAEHLALMQESLMLMRLVKVYLMEPFNQNRVERQLSNNAKAQLRNFWGEAIYRPLLVFFGLTAALILLFITGVMVDSGRLGMAGALVLATALVSLYLPALQWLDARRILRRARDSAVVLFEFLDRPGDVGQAIEADFLPPLQDKLVFDNVNLKEPGTGRRLLRGINLTIEAGQHIALVGPDNMEKHALAYLIPRFLDPTSGEIRIDGRNLKFVTLDSLRAQIAVVLQHNLVFNDTVANNIGCGDRSYSLPQLTQAAKSAHAHMFIQKLPNGYETEIGEMGFPLNIGQQFRIALARALLRDPALMIVEEPIAPLDEETKDLLDDTMTRFLPGRTVVFLPHRLSTIKHCDKVYLLFGGRVEASGGHKELIGKSDLYRHLQYLEYNEFAGILGDKAFAEGEL